MKLSFTTGLASGPSLAFYEWGCWA